MAVTAELGTENETARPVERCAPGVLGANGFEARYSEGDAIGVASPNNVAQYFGGGEIDI